MTDKEIIKYLEQAIDKYNKNEIFVDNMRLDKLSLDIINRQKAQIERLKIENQSLRSAANSYKLHYNEAGTEAIKEFTERLKNKIKTECNPYGKPTFDYDTSLAIMRYIDNLLKEMAGETDD